MALNTARTWSGLCTGRGPMDTATYFPPADSLWLTSGGGTGCPSADSTHAVMARAKASPPLPMALNRRWLG